MKPITFERTSLGFLFILAVLGIILGLVGWVRYVI